MAKKLGYLREMKIYYTTHYYLYPCSSFNCILNKSYGLTKQKNCLRRLTPVEAPEGKRKRGRQKETWRHTVKKERTAHAGAWAEASTIARDRDQRMELISRPIPHTG